MENSIFMQRLKELRKEKAVLQITVAKFLGITKSGYGCYEQGKNKPSLELVEKLADYFDVSLDYLLGRSDKRK